VDILTRINFQIRSYTYASLLGKYCEKETSMCEGRIIIIIIGIQPLGQSGQRPEFSQATGIALVCCILGKFLGVACHCFPPKAE